MCTGLETYGKDSKCGLAGCKVLPESQADAKRGRLFLCVVLFGQNFRLEREPASDVRPGLTAELGVIMVEATTGLIELL